MSNHYYNSNLETKSNVKLLKHTLLDQELQFFTDHGVFSKGSIDHGTLVLIHSYEWKASHLKALDLGCGYGPIGISLAKKFSTMDVEMVDVNLRAIELAKQNLVKNQVSNARVFESDGFQNIDKTYDVIFTNPPIRAGKSVVHKLFEDSFRHLNPLGELYVVIQKKQGAPSAKAKLESVFGNCETIKKDRGYYVLKSIKSA